MSTNEVGPDTSGPTDDGNAVGRNEDEMVSEYPGEGSAGGALGTGNLGDGDVDGIGDDGGADDGLATSMGGPA